MKAAFRDGRIGRNPAQGIRLPRLERREAAYLAPEVVDQIADAMPAAYYLFVSILGALGPRFGEGAGLRRRSVDLLPRRLVISESLAEVGGQLTFGPTKTHAQRSVPPPRSIAERLADHLDTIPADQDTLPFTSPAAHLTATRTSGRRSGDRRSNDSSSKRSGSTSCATPQPRD